MCGFFCGYSFGEHKIAASPQSGRGFQSTIAKEAEQGWFGPGKLQHPGKGERSILCSVFLCNRAGLLFFPQRKRKEKKHGENDLNQGKWIGIGGKFEDKESPEDCLLRECREETGLTLTDYRYRGLVTFVNTRWPTEYMHLFTATGWMGTPHPCDEGELEWIPKAELRKLPMWAGDRIFLRLLDSNEPFFSLKLCKSEAKRS